MATLWANVVLSPEEAGIGEDDLPTLYDLVVSELVDVIGEGTDLETVYRFVSSSRRKNHDRSEVESDPQRFVAVLFQHDLGSRRTQTLDGRNSQRPQKVGLAGLNVHYQSPRSTLVMAVFPNNPADPQC